MLSIFFSTHTLLPQQNLQILPSFFVKNAPFHYLLTQFFPFMLQFIRCRKAGVGGSSWSQGLHFIEKFFCPLGWLCLNNVKTKKYTLNLNYILRYYVLKRKKIFWVRFDPAQVKRWALQVLHVAMRPATKSETGTDWNLQYFKLTQDPIAHWANLITFLFLDACFQLTKEKELRIQQILFLISFKFDRWSCANIQDWQSLAFNL